MADEGSTPPKRPMSKAELDALQGRIDDLRSRLLTPAPSRPLGQAPVKAPSALLVMKRRRSWALAPLAMAVVLLALVEAAALVIVGHGFVNVTPFLFLVWWPLITQSGELRVHDGGIEIPGTAGIVLPWADMEGVERHRWGEVPVLSFDAIVGYSSKVYGDRRKVVIRLTPFMADWTTGPFADLLRLKRPQLLSAGAL